MQNSAGQAFRIRYDSETGVVRVVLNAELSEDEFARYRDEMAAAVATARAASPIARVLIDGRELEAMPATAPDRIAQLGQMYTPDDRIAMIVRSSLLKIEARRVAHSECVQGFVSEHAAWTWLMAYSVPHSSAA